ncbi:hypothetical protein SAMN05428977_100843 [Nitrosomonas sp. Nm166]|nr:hypothetical protein SAMN05428977_100843 [Nitrosomonas sp. Nm166]
MKIVTIETPFVSECSAPERTYNLNSNCHAQAITIGDGMHPAATHFWAAGPCQSCHTHSRDWCLQD